MAWSKSESKAKSNLYNDMAMFCKPTDELWKEAWRITEAVFLLMRSEVVQRGVKLFVVVLTDPSQVHPDPLWRAKVAIKKGVQDWFYPDRRIEKFCKSERIPVLLLASTFQDYATTHQVYLHGFKNTLGFGGNLGGGHWNQNGHRLAGKLIAEWLCKQVN